MAIVISSRSKLVTGLVVTAFGLVLTLVIGSAVGWFDPDQEDLSLPRSRGGHGFVEKVSCDAPFL